MSPEVETALDEFKQGVERAFAERLVRVVLFGSQARGIVHADSDVDVLVLVSPRAPGDGHRAVAVAVAGMLARPDVVLSPLVMTPEELADLRAHERRLARDIDREGLTL